MVSALSPLSPHSVGVAHSRSPSFFLAAEAERKQKEVEASGEKEDYKGESKFASHLKSNAGVSSFARNKTLKEQREYLPAFACREDLMKILRDNQGMHFISYMVYSTSLHFSKSSLLLAKQDLERQPNWLSFYTKMATVNMVSLDVLNPDELPLCQSLSVSVKRWRCVADVQ